jgi:hypothetical protein
MDKRILKKFEEHSTLDPFGEEDWNFTDYKKLFKDFLKKKRLEESFYRNFAVHHNDRNIDEYLNNTNKNLYIINAFCWDTTDEIIDWNTIDDEWLDTLLKTENKNDEDVNESNYILDPYDEEYWEDIREIFINFLKENDAYEFFDINLKKRNRNLWTLFHKEYPMDYIGHSFDWDNTQEGSNYWRKLHYKWTELLKKMYWKDKYVKENIDVDPFGEENWDEYDYIKKFTDFLKLYDIEEKFKNNLKLNNLDFNYFISIQIPENYVLAAFNWDESKEGIFFWKKYNMLWEKILRSNFMNFTF